MCEGGNNVIRTNARRDARGYAEDKGEGEGGGEGETVARARTGVRALIKQR